MLKASALYIVIIIAFIIALICTSLIAAAYIYRAGYQQKIRFDRLHNNLESGISLLLSQNDTSFRTRQKIALFDNDSDSLQIARLSWGAYDIGTVQAFIQRDTLYKSFMVANRIDSSKWSALHLIDEDRPVSVSGKTSIRGDVYIPTAGIRASYVDNQAYTGDPKFVDGHIRNSGRDLPGLEGQRIETLKYSLSHPIEYQPFSLSDSTIENSFLNTTRSVRLKEPDTLRNISLKGNLILYSDTSLFIDSSAKLNNVIIFAKSVSIGAYFKGKCQIFVSDSITVGRGSEFTYPSCLALLRTVPVKSGQRQAQIMLGEKTIFNGTIFCYEQEKSLLPSYISLEKNARVNGQLYAQGNISLKDSVKIYGSVSCKQLIYQTGFTAYQNFLINVTISSKALSPFYLSSALLPAVSKKKKVLQWLERN